MQGLCRPTHYTAPALSGPGPSAYSASFRQELLLGIRTSPNDVLGTSLAAEGVLLLASCSPFRSLLAALERPLAHACPGEEPRLLRGGPLAASSDPASPLGGRRK